MFRSARPLNQVFAIQAGFRMFRSSAVQLGMNVIRGHGLGFGVYFPHIPKTVHCDDRYVAGIIGPIIGMLSTGILPFVYGGFNIGTQRAGDRVPERPAAVTFIAITCRQGASPHPQLVEFRHVFHIVLTVMGRVTAEPRPHFLEID